MKRPTVRQAHAICESVKAKAVIILALSDDQVAGASYGETRALCKQAGYTLDCIVGCHRKRQDSRLDNRAVHQLPAHSRRGRGGAVLSTVSVAEFGLRLRRGIVSIRAVG